MAQLHQVYFNHNQNIKLVLADAFCVESMNFSYVNKTNNTIEIIKNNWNLFKLNYNHENILFLLQKLLNSNPSNLQPKCLFRLPELKPDEWFLDNNNKKSMLDLVASSLTQIKKSKYPELQLIHMYYQLFALDPLVLFFLNTNYFPFNYQYLAYETVTTTTKYNKFKQIELQLISLFSNSLEKLSRIVIIQKLFNKQTNPTNTILDYETFFSYYIYFTYYYDQVNFQLRRAIKGILERYFPLVHLLFETTKSLASSSSSPIYVIEYIIRPLVKQIDTQLLEYNWYHVLLPVDSKKRSSEQTSYSIGSISRALNRANGRVSLSISNGILTHVVANNTDSLLYQNNIDTIMPIIGVVSDYVRLIIFNSLKKCLIVSLKSNIQIVNATFNLLSNPIVFTIKINYVQDRPARTRRRVIILDNVSTILAESVYVVIKNVDQEVILERESKSSLLITNIFDPPYSIESNIVENKVDVNDGGYDDEYDESKITNTSSYWFSNVFDFKYITRGEGEDRVVLISSSSSQGLVDTFKIIDLGNRLLTQSSSFTSTLAQEQYIISQSINNRVWAIPASKLESNRLLFTNDKNNYSLSFSLDQQQQKIIVGTRTRQPNVLPLFNNKTFYNQITNPLKLNVTSPLDYACFTTNLTYCDVNIDAITRESSSGVYPIFFFIKIVLCRLDLSLNNNDDDTYILKSNSLLTRMTVHVNSSSLVEVNIFANHLVTSPSSPAIFSLYDNFSQNLLFCLNIS